MERALRAELLPALAGLPVLPAKLGNAAAMVGAARLVLTPRPDTIFLSPSSNRPPNIQRNPTVILTPEALEALRGQLIVSCQAYPGEPCAIPAPWRSLPPRQ